MELLAQQLVVGLFLPPLSVPGVPGATGLNMDKLNRIWADVTSLYEYRQLEVSPDRSAGMFQGISELDGVTIQPPLVQVRIGIGASDSVTAQQAAEKAYDVLKIIARYLGVSQFFNLGVRHVYRAVVPDNDARSLVLHRILGKAEEELGDLASGAGVLGGVKFVVPHADGAIYTLVIEPLFADNRFLHLDLDAQFPGVIGDLEPVKVRAREAETYITGRVNSYLDRAIQ